ncbi:alpha/beta fold hydrolase [Spiractinospora alimapuensis]|nr:alpha/beta fold hydrolase [Spiractinospora alimapuensis]
MTAPEFAPLADALADTYTVVTYDPRGYGRSTIEDPDQDTTPRLAADDVGRVLSTVGPGPVRVFGSSGGGVTALELVATHPDQVLTAVVHEPPTVHVLPDAAELEGVATDIRATLRAGDPEIALGAFLSFAGFTVDEALPSPPPGRDAEQTTANARRMIGHSLVPTTTYIPDLPALRAAGVRLVLGVGSDSVGTLAHRATLALADELATEVVTFPGGHTGFVDERGSGVAPEEFTHVLRGLLASTDTP